MTYQDNGISFNDVKFHQGLAVGAIPLEIGGVSSPGLDDGDGIINVVDIDWNGAVLPNANITSGGSVTINANKTNVLKMLRAKVNASDPDSKTLIETYFIDGDKYSMDSTLNSQVNNNMNGQQLGELIIYENWTKQ